MSVYNPSSVCRSRLPQCFIRLGGRKFQQHGRREQGRSSKTIFAKPTQSAVLSLKLLVKNPTVELKEKTRTFLQFRLSNDGSLLTPFEPFTQNQSFQIPTHSSLFLPIPKTSPSRAKEGSRRESNPGPLAT